MLSVILRKRYKQYNIMKIVTYRNYQKSVIAEVTFFVTTEITKI